MFFTVFVWSYHTSFAKWFLDMVEIFPMLTLKRVIKQTTSSLLEMPKVDDLTATSHGKCQYDEKEHPSHWFYKYSLREKKTFLTTSQIWVSNSGFWVIIILNFTSSPPHIFTCPNKVLLDWDCGLVFCFFFFFFFGGVRLLTLDDDLLISLNCLDNGTIIICKRCLDLKHTKMISFNFVNHPWQVQFQFECQETDNIFQLNSSLQIAVQQ